MKIIFLFTFLLLAHFGHAQFADQSGVYSGSFSHKSFSSDIEFEIKQENGSHQIKFNSLSQNAFGIPAGDIRISSDTLFFALQSDYYRYDFSCFPLGQPKMSGSLRVDGNTYDFNLQRQVKTSTQDAVSKDIRFRSQGLLLYGTIYYPNKPNGMAVYLVTSSGDQDRSGSRAEALLFAKAGYISFHIDKRGTGISDGNWQAASIPELCQDDLNALEYLHEVEKMAYGVIGIKGSSQGATKVPYILKKQPQLAFGIVVSCPASTLWESDLNYWKNRNVEIIGKEHIEEASIMQGAVFQYIGLGLSKLKLDELIEQNRSKSWFEHIWIPELDQVAFDKKLNYSPLPYFKDLSVPILVIQGTEDQIIPESSLKDIKKTMGKNKHKKTKFVSLKGADHSMMINGSSDFPYWSSLHPDYLDKIFNWIP